MKAVMLAGGRGTRLRPLTDRTPKQLLPIAGLPMMERVLSHLAGHGITHVVLSLGHQPEAFLEHLPDARCGGVELSYAVEPEPLDTGGGIAYAARVAQLDSTFLVVNGDVLTNLDISALVRAHHRFGTLGTLAVARVEDPSRFGVVVVDENGRVERFVEKPPPGTAPGNLINAGTYVLEPEVLEEIPQDRSVSVERAVFPSLSARSALSAAESDAYSLDCGKPESFLQGTFDVLCGRLPHCRVPGREVEPGIWLAPEASIRGAVTAPALVEHGATLEPGSVVHGAAIGPAVRVGASALVYGSVLLAGTSVGARATVKGSIVGSGAEIGAGARLLSGSVVAAGAVIPAGTVVDGRWESSRCR